MNVYQIAYVSPEVVPFAKTGGLADVAGALPPALAKLGNAVKVFMPLYGAVDTDTHDIKSLKTGIAFDIAGKTQHFDLYYHRDDSSGCDYYFIKIDEYFDRVGLYVSPETGRDWEDNDERFIAFSNAILKAIKELEFKPDIIHCNDWQSGLIPAFLKNSNDNSGYFEQAKTVLTIHNIAYQGLFPEESFAKLGLDSKLFFPTSDFEYYGKVNFLKAGIQFADMITTVSEKYAKEIQALEEYGCGLEGILRDRAENLFGVVNGIDYEIWNPATDTLIKANYKPEKPANKKKNKNTLRRVNKLPMVRKDIPLIGIISRLCDQKGFDLIAEAAEQIFELDLQVVVLGTGDEKYETMLKDLTDKYPKKLAVNLKFDNELAHLIEAGSDMFLMPSRYEPCGLNQLFSLKYGTVPIVRETGGLADTIENCNPARGTGTGFIFKNYDSNELLNTIRFAIEVYKNKSVWESLMQNGMSQDFSWDKSAARYLEIYHKAIVKETVST
ncbi:MAG: glycogen synthase GlgA [candidate division Zixibacteria bacterium]|nr:glycogen synthase GlgA [candidate division Zixibacteria bacterium]